MIPKSLSASAAAVFEGCEARFHAEYIERTPDLSNSAALLGTVDHAALEAWVNEGHYLAGYDEQTATKVMADIYEQHYWKYFSDRDRYAEGYQMAERWRQRHRDWTGRTVLMTETKASFDLKTSIGVIPFNYIFDRLDKVTRADEGYDIEVVDYKTVGTPVQPEQMKARIQPRAYGLAAMILYPEARQVWVTYDLLRYDEVGIRLTREDNIETWNYLRHLAERIIASTGERETLNPDCSFCVRKAVCEKLKAHMRGGGVLGMMDDPEVIADERAKLDYARGAINQLMDAYDEALLRHMEENELANGFQTNSTKVTITAQKRRDADSERVAKVVGPEIMAEYGKIGITAVDDMLKDDRLTQEQKSSLRQLIRTKYGNPRIKTAPISPHDAD